MGFRVFDPEGHPPYQARGLAHAGARRAVRAAGLRARPQSAGGRARLWGLGSSIQKGIHLTRHAAWRTLERGAQFVLQGSAPDPKVQVDLLGCGVRVDFNVAGTHTHTQSI